MRPGLASIQYFNTRPAGAGGRPPEGFRLLERSEHHFGYHGVMVVTNESKVRETKCRRAAARQGLVLLKSRRRDPRALTFGTYGLVDASTNAWVTYDGGSQAGYGLSLDEIEEWLNKPAS